MTENHDKVRSNLTFVLARILGTRQLSDKQRFPLNPVLLHTGFL